VRNEEEERVNRDRNDVFTTLTWFDRKSGVGGHEDLARQSPASKDMGAGPEESTF
jgi:hypothetical protein